MKTLNNKFQIFVIFWLTPFNQNLKHIQISIKNEISIKTFYQSLQVYILSKLCL
jgi:hypothetical protein